jgi:hypothetical protein
MNCDKVLDFLYDTEYSGYRFSFIARLLVFFHISHCPKCAAHRRALQSASDCLKEDFFPPASGIAEKVMALLGDDDAFTLRHQGYAAMSFRSWLIAGLAVLVSLSSASLGVGYLTPANMRTVYFTLAVGITVGAVITAFVAIFIGSHIAELSRWLGLDPDEPPRGKPRGIL